MTPSTSRKKLLSSGGCGAGAAERAFALLGAPDLEPCFLVEPDFPAINASEAIISQI